MNEKKVFVLFAIFSTFTFFPGRLISDQNTKLFVGILEGTQYWINYNKIGLKLENYEPSGEKSITNKTTAIVRVAFEKDGNQWVPMKSDITPNDFSNMDRYYPKEMSWAIIFDGKYMGKIRSRQNVIHSYGEIGSQEIYTEDKNSIPIIKTGASDFDYPNGYPNMRPLLLASANNFKDPEFWKPSLPSDGEKKIAISAFRNIEPTMARLYHYPSGEIVNTIAYSDDDVKLVKAYRSKVGTLLIGVQINGKLNNTEDMTPKEFLEHWFVIKKDQTVKPIGVNIHPIDAADLDNDGKSEWMFLGVDVESGEYYSYLLFYDDFSKSAVYEIHTH
jgi:hypothetical protein